MTDNGYDSDTLDGVAASAAAKAATVDKHDGCVVSHNGNFRVGHRHGSIASRNNLDLCRLYAATKQFSLNSGRSIEIWVQSVASKGHFWIDAWP